MTQPALLAYTRALDHLARVQKPNGAFAGEVIWNPMLVCQYVVVCHILGRPIDAKRRERVILSLRRQVRPDGGWGMHPDSDTWLFHTVLGYVTLRLLEVPADDPLCARALAWIHAHGGPYLSPTWGRLWLAMLGLYPWSAVQPIVPEVWLLPPSLPVHPSRLYCHMRLIYLGLSYVYGSKFVAPTSAIVESLRRELYPEGYDPARFEQHRDEIAATDLFEAPSPGLRAAFAALRALDRASPGALRHRALERAYDHILFEFRSTGYVCLSPVNGLLFCLALHIRDPEHRELDKALHGLEYWFWEDDEEGARICGARSDIWDTAFVIQALCEGPGAGPHGEIVRRACAYLPIAQIQEEVLGGQAHFRELAYGGWGFADEHHPWPVSDCTAEALEALLHAEARDLSGPEGRLDLGRKLAAVAFILLRQNDDGGFGSYEARRGPMFLRGYNPAEIYGNCMLEYSYTECTGSCIRALALAERTFGEHMPDDLRARTRAAVRRGAEAVRAAQDGAGGWAGFWGINFTYGTLFATSGLRAAGEPAGSERMTRAVRWLLTHQRPDGGWGESFEGMLDGSDVPLPEGEPSLVVQTAWALLTLMELAPGERDAIDRGVAYLTERQRDGTWPRERATGCFFNTAVLDYDLYRHTFPTWALARYLSRFGSQPTGAG